VLSHLSADELGSPVRLRWRGCKGKQIASVPDRPARVVGTSTLSDGNVLAHPTEAVRDRRTARNPGRKARASHLDEPAGVVTCKDHGGDGCIVFDGPDHRPSRADAPARTLTRNTYGDGALLVNERHPINRLDEPSFTVTTKGDGRGAQGACVLALSGHPSSRWEEPALGIPSSQPGNGGMTILDSLQAPGSRANAIKLSERAAAILQGFPDGWVFAGATKKARWAQIGMAMPPPLAEAVGRSIARVLRAREAAAE
jgi:site-specific DNA-cytosine methylase